MTLIKPMIIGGKDGRAENVNVVKSKHIIAINVANNINIILRTAAILPSGVLS
jgi:hypothetical protein